MDEQGGMPTPQISGLHYNIQIHLPATKDAEVYNAIFKSLREHLGLLICRQVLPKPDGLHFKELIIRSMSNRYANYVRDRDQIRGDLMKMLLQRAGVDVARLSGEVAGNTTSTGAPRNR